MLEVTEIQTEPIVEPVSIGLVKQYLREDSDYDVEDEILTLFIKSARRWCEKYTGLSLAPKRLHLNTDKCNIELLYGPVKEVISVKNHLDSVIDYVKKGNNIFVYADSGTNIIYDAGYSELPEEITVAIAMLAASMFDNRDKENSGIPSGVKDLLQPYSRSGGLFL